MLNFSVTCFRNTHAKSFQFLHSAATRTHCPYIQRGYAYAETPDDTATDICGYLDTCRIKVHFFTAVPEAFSCTFPSVMLAARSPVISFACPYLISFACRYLGLQITHAILLTPARATGVAGAPSHKPKNHCKVEKLFSAYKVPTEK